MIVHGLSFKKTVNIFNRIGLWLLIISLNFGNSITFLGMSLSRLITLFVFLGVSLNIVPNIICSNYSKRKFAFIFIVFWFVYAFFQRIWAIDIPSWNSLFVSTCINLFICLAVLTETRDETSFRFILSATHISLWLQICVGALEKITESSYVETTTRDKITWIHSFFGNPNDYASWIYICFISALIYIFLLENKQKRGKVGIRIYLCMLTVASMITLIHSESRSGIGSLLLFVLLYFWGRVWFFLEGRNKTLRPLGKLVIISTCVMVGFFVAYLIISDDLLDTVLSQSGVMYNSDLSRINLMRESISIFFQSYCLGVGSGQSAYIIGFPPHNFFLEILSDFGIFIFGGIFVILISSWKQAFNGKYKEHERAALFAFFPSFVLMSIGSSSLLRLRIVWILIFSMYIWSNRLYKENKRLDYKNENTNDLWVLSLRNSIK